MRYNYCPLCGMKLTHKKSGDDGLIPYCVRCDKRWFDAFESCIIIAVYNEYNEMVIARQNYLSDKYATVTSGYITPGETAEECAIREVKEEIGLDLEHIEYAGTYWFGLREQLMHGFVGFTHKQELKLSEEVDAAEWIFAPEAEKNLFPDKPGGALYEVYHKLLGMCGLE